MRSSFLLLQGVSRWSQSPWCCHNRQEREGVAGIEESLADDLNGGKPVDWKEKFPLF